MTRSMSLTLALAAAALPVPSHARGTSLITVKVNKLSDQPAPPQRPPAKPKHGKVYRGGSVPGGKRRASTKDGEAARDA
jgi:hypothetical protein